MKILVTGLVLHPNWKGGEPKVAHQLISFLRQNGYDVLIDYAAYYFKDLAIKNDPNIALNDYYKNLLKHYIKTINKFKPDLIIAFYDNGTTTILEAAHKSNIPIILYIHIVWPVCPKGMLVDEKYNQCVGIRNVSPIKCIKCSILSSNKDLPSTLGAMVNAIFTPMRIHARYLRLTYDNLRLIVVPSNYMKNILAKNGIDPSKIYVLPNGIDTNFYKPTPLPKTNTIAYLGGCDPLKGFDELLLAFKKIIKHRNDVTLYIAGTNHKGEISNKIILTGYLNENETKHLYEISKVVVVPSIIPEAFSLVTAEAMASARPVVAYNSGAISELVKDGYNGYLVKIHDIDSLADKILYLINNQEHAEAMGKNAREFIEKNYNIDLFYKRWDELLQTILK